LTNLLWSLSNHFDILKIIFITWHFPSAACLCVSSQQAISNISYGFMGLSGRPVQGVSKNDPLCFFCQNFYRVAPKK